MKGPNYPELEMQLDSGFPEAVSGLPEAVFGKPTMVSGYTDAELDGGSIFFTAGEDGESGTLEVPVTLKNGLTNSWITFSNLGGDDAEGPICPPRLGAVVSYSVEGGSSGEVNVICPKDFEPGMADDGTPVYINWG